MIEDAFWEGVRVAAALLGFVGSIVLAVAACFAALCVILLIFGWIDGAIKNRRPKKPISGGRLEP